jgi:acyl-CoA thioesterase I
MVLSYLLSVTRGARASLRVAVFFLAVAFSMVPPSAQAATSIFENLQAGKAQTVVLYGTSLTSGGEWTKAVKKWFDVTYPGLVNVVNSAGPGQNSDWGLKNLNSRVLAHKPDLVLLEFSYNDASEKFQLPLERGMQNLDAMVKALEGFNPAATIVLQVMNIGWDAPNGNRSQSTRPRLEAFNDNYRNLCTHSFDDMLLDHYPNWRKLKETEPRVFQSYVPDGTHPNATGSLKVTWPVVKGWLEDQRKRAPAP